MKDFIEYLVKNIVSDPAKVEITLKEGTEGTLIEIRVAPADIGKVVGRGGKVIQSLRTISRSIGVRIGKKVHLEVMQGA